MVSSSSDLIGGILVVVGGIIGVAVFLAFLAFWIWMLIHSLTNNGLSGSEKIAWVLVIIFVQLIEAIIYYFVGRPKANLSPPPS